MLTIKFSANRPSDARPLALPIAKDEAVDAHVPAGVAEVAKAAAARFTGEAGSIAELYAPVDGAVRHILLVGTGADAAADKAGGALVAKLLATETGLVVDVTGIESAERAEFAARLAQAAMLRSWRYDVYRTKLPEKQKPTLAEVEIVAGDQATAAEQAFAPLKAAAEGAALTRMLVTEPANILYPESFVERCRQEMEGLGLEIEVLDEPAMRKLGMGALLGVAQGSVRPPRLLAIKWDGTGGKADPVAFVGKGVTFDTGGISIKAAPGMEDMKWDMGGAGAVAGAMKALALRKAKAHVIGVCGLVENMPDGNAQRPGDVVTTGSGQTVEVLNTDAEGRLVLCDALWWVQQKYHPRTIVDLATLTGAMIVSLGHEHGGLFANDDALADQLVAAGKAVGEKLWRMPLGDAYDKLLESPIADMKNIGPREAGSITAAQFLARFVDEGVKWAHLDIAGMVWAAKPGTFWDKGATSYGARLLDQFVKDALEK